MECEWWTGELENHGLRATKADLSEYSLGPEAPALRAALSSALVAVEYPIARRMATLLRG